MEENNESAQNPTLFQHAIKFGGILGVVAFVLTLIVYAMNYTMLADWKFGIIVLVASLGFIIYAGINFRTQIGGFVPYGQAFQHAFVVLAVAGFVGLLGNLLLYTVIDPDLPQKVADAAIEKTSAMLAGFGTPEDKVDEAIEKLRVEMPAKFAPLGLLKSYLWSLIFYAVIAAITGLIVKKNQPEMM